MAEAPPILIVGGGIGGLALALALARRGRRSQVLEQRKDFAATGAGIQLGPNGVRALERLGLTQALSRFAGVPTAITVRAGRTARVLATLPLGAWIAARHGAPYWVAHRADLHHVLLSAAAAEPLIALRTGFAFTAPTASDGGVGVRSAAGAITSGSALVGADGLWSSVRQFICPTSAPQFAGATATRAVIPAASAGPLAGSMVGLWLSPGVHVVHYPVRAASEIAVVVIAAEDSRDRAPDRERNREWEVAAEAAPLLRRLGGFHPSLTEVLADVHDWRKWGLYRAARLPAWSKGRITLIGDAAHPMLPYLAQGGALALEDALVLADCVRAHAGDEARAFLSFEATRRARAERAERASARQGGIYHLPPPLSWGRDCVLRNVSGTRLMARLDWLYGWPGRQAASAPLGALP
jgi:salicylate hydroxylase